MIDFQGEVEALKQKISERRRDFHRYPESGWTEYRTAAIVAEQLEKFGYEVHVGREACHSESRMGVPSLEVLRHHEERAIAEGADPQWINRMKDGHTAVVGAIRGSRPGPVIALRFDIDALDLVESDDFEHVPMQKGFASVHAGLMHACAHDGHTTIGLTVAEMVAKHKDELVGDVRLLFQPAEEGCRGAKSLVDAGWLDGVDYFFSGHIGTKSRTLGEIVAATSGFLATSKIDVEYIGEAAHAGGSPEQGKNALLAAATAVLNLHGISRHGQGRSRVNVGRLEAGTGRNVIADHARLKLETRGETQEINEFIAGRAKQIIEGAAIMHEVASQYHVVGEGPNAVSSEEIVPWIAKEAKKMNRVTSFVPHMTFGASEDVAWMLNRVIEGGGKGTFMLFGTPLKQGHHQKMFDFDETVLQIAAEILLRCIFACSSWGLSENDVQADSKL